MTRTILAVTLLAIPAFAEPPTMSEQHQAELWTLLEEANAAKGVQCNKEWDMHKIGRSMSVPLAVFQCARPMTQTELSAALKALDAKESGADKPEENP